MSRIVTITDGIDEYDVFLRVARILQVEGIAEPCGSIACDGAWHLCADRTWGEVEVIDARESVVRGRARRLD